ncbi:MAG TPA: cation-transporting P-type ATPase [Dissulfurispiraceae bacterium]|nr:cation-transporting P-type ATPase [Dissulfurispiraceae bacterium]
MKSKERTETDNGPAFWQEETAALLARLGVTAEGLSVDEASRRFTHFGPNQLRHTKKRLLLFQFLSKFLNPLVLVLLTASVISAFTGDVASFVIISAIILISVTLDFVQEHRAGQAAERLRQSVAVHAQVLRDGSMREIPLSDLVPGDIALLAAGDLVPGDGRLLEAKDFFVNQALLTGEPYPVEKTPGELRGEPEVLSANNIVLLGTSVISGTAKVLICRTGAGTVLGDIADTLITKAPPTAFEIGTRRFGMLIMRLTVLLVLFVFLANALFHCSFLSWL